MGAMCVEFKSSSEHFCVTQTFNGKISTENEAIASFAHKKCESQKKRCGVRWGLEPAQLQCHKALAIGNC